MFIFLSYGRCQGSVFVGLLTESCHFLLKVGEWGGASPGWWEGFLLASSCPQWLRMMHENSSWKCHHPPTKLSKKEKHWPRRCSLWATWSRSCLSVVGDKASPESGVAWDCLPIVVWHSSWDFTHQSPAWWINEFFRAYIQEQKWLKGI